jgi:hypothetical protein
VLDGLCDPVFTFCLWRRALMIYQQIVHEIEIEFSFADIYHALRIMLARVYLLLFELRKSSFSRDYGHRPQLMDNV